MRGGYIHCVGIGPGGEDGISVGAREAILAADEVWLQDLGPPGFERLFLRPLLSGKKVVNTSGYYSLEDVRRLEFYRLFTRRLIALARRGRRITVLDSGNPLVWVSTTEELKLAARRGEIELRITPSMSFLDVIFQRIPLAMAEMQLRIGTVIDPDISPYIDTVIGQIGDQGRTSTADPRTMMRKLRQLFPPSHPVYLVGSGPVDGEQEIEETTIGRLGERLDAWSHLFHVAIIPRRSRRRGSRDRPAAARSRRRG